MSRNKEPWFFGTADLLAPPYDDSVLAALQRDRAWLQSCLQGPQKPGSGATSWSGMTTCVFSGRQRRAGDRRSEHGLLLVAGRRRRDPRQASRCAIRVHARTPPTGSSRFTPLNLWHTPRASFREWFQSALDTPQWWPSIVGAGRYATHLERWRGIWPRERMRIYLYDDYRADPHAVLRDLFTFLDVRPDYPIDLSRKYNESTVPPGSEACRRCAGGCCLTRYSRVGSRNARAERCIASTVARARTWRWIPPTAPWSSTTIATRSCVPRTSSVAISPAGYDDGVGARCRAP